MSTPKKPGTDLAALKARLAKKNKKAAEPEPAPAPAPEAAAAAPEPEAATPAADPSQPGQATPEPAPAAAAPEYAAPAAAAPVAAAPVATPAAVTAPVQEYAAPPPAAAPASDDPFGGGGGGGFDPSEGLIDSGGEIPSKSNAGLAIFAGLVGIMLGATGGYLGSKISRNNEATDAASQKGTEMAAAVEEIKSGRISISTAMEGIETKMATDPKAAAAEIDGLMKEKFSAKVDVSRLFGWQLAAVNGNGVRRTFELFDETTRLQKDLGYLSAFLSSQANALKTGGGPSQFAVKFNDKGRAMLVAAIKPLCATGGGEGEGGEAGAATTGPCPEGKMGAAVAYEVLETLGGEPVTLPRGAGPGQVTLIQPGGPIYEYAVGMEPNRNALIMRNALLKRAKDHLDEMAKAETIALKALENYAANPTVDGSTEQPDPAE